MTCSVRRICACVRAYKPYTNWLSDESETKACSVKRLRKITFHKKQSQILMHKMKNNSSFDLNN